MTEAPAPARKTSRLGRAGRVGIALGAVVAIAAGVWLAFTHRVSPWADRLVVQRVVVDDDAVLVRKDDVEHHRVQVSRVDGSGAVIWASEVDVPESASATERIVIPVAESGVATLGTLVGWSLQD